MADTVTNEGRSGITANTPANIMFGAGTIHKNLKYTAGADGTTGSWNFQESLVGATNGGSKFSIVPEVYKVPVDGANVNVKGLTKKISETATMEINFAEVTKDVVTAATFGELGTSEDTAYDVILAKEDITEGDYWDNIAFVGKTLEGKNIIVIMENALCTSGFSTEGKPKAEGVVALTFECYAKLEGSHDKLPYQIYLPKAI